MDIVAKSTTIQNISTVHGQIHFALEAMQIVQQKDGRMYRKVRVIIAERREGVRTFLSVMDKRWSVSRFGVWR